ncbi:hypothetical protein ACFJI1_15520 [Pseudoxanthomonas sp. UC29_72]
MAWSVRRVAATSSASDVVGFCTATTFSRARSSRAMTTRQLEASAQAPCTRTTVGLGACAIDDFS